jgi:hypothetical protein
MSKDIKLNRLLSVAKGRKSHIHEGYWENMTGRELGALKARNMNHDVGHSGTAPSLRYAFKSLHVIVYVK